MQHLIDQVLKAPIGGRRKRIAIKFLRTNIDWWSSTPESLTDAFGFLSTPQGHEFWAKIYIACNKAKSLSV